MPVLLTLFFLLAQILYIDKGESIITDQGGVQSFVNHIELGLCFVVESLHKVFMSFFPVFKLSLSQGSIVENLSQETSIMCENFDTVLIFQAY